MKKFAACFSVIMALVMMLFSAAAFAAPNDENPYKNAYAKEAQALRKQGTAKIVYQFMTRDRRPLAGITMLYNTTQEKGLMAVSDEKGMVEFDLKNAEVYYIHHVVFGEKILPVQGSSQVNMVEKLDIRKGTVFWNCIVQYGNSAFMSYRGN